MAYRVTAPYVTAKVRSDIDGVKVAEFYSGAVLPEATEQDSVKHLLAKGMIERVPTSKAEPTKAEPTKAEPGTGRTARTRDGN